MVLNHVAHGAGIVVVAPAALDTDGFGHGNLHVIDTGTVPARLENAIGKAQRQQVLDRFFTQVVVDAINAGFGEHSIDRAVDDSRTF